MLFSSPIVKIQIYAKRFTQDIIDTLGSRWRELVLPIPKDAEVRKGIEDDVKEAVDLRKRANELAWQSMQRIAPPGGDVTLLDDESEYGFGIRNQ